MLHPEQPESKRRNVTNEERDCHAYFGRTGFSLPIPITQHRQVVEGSEVIDTPFVSVTNWLKYLLAKMPCLLAGGRNSLQTQLDAFWKLYRFHHADHEVFAQPNLQLDHTIPLCLFSDEGKGPKRGNYLLMSVESMLGLTEMPADFECSCAAHVGRTSADIIPQCYGEIGVSDATVEAAKQSHNLKGHSHLTRHLLFGLPDWVYKQHGEVLEAMMSYVTRDMRKLFYVGITVSGRRFWAALVALKGDMKQIAEKFCRLSRSYAHLGRVRCLGMCSHCLAGTSPQLPWNQISHEPSWATTLFEERPWQDMPVLCQIPYDSSKPEAVLKFDVFHLFKVGLGRDLVGSLVLLARLGHYDFNEADSKTLKQRLQRAFQHFKLWRLAERGTAACTRFSPALFNVKKLSDYAWANIKGSDTMLLLGYLRFFVGDILRSCAVPDSHRRLFRVLRQTIDHCNKAFDIMYTHGLWLQRACAQSLYIHLMALMSGYQSLAAQSLALRIACFCLKPKFHGLHHVAFDLSEALKGPGPLILNPLAFSCEQGEDMMGKVCTLSLKVSVRTINYRVVQRYFLKKAALIRRHKRQRVEQGLPF